MAEVQEVQEVAGQLRGALAAPRLHAHTLHSHSENHLDDGQGALFWSWDEASGNDGQSRGTKIIAGCEMVKLAKGTPETKCLLLQDRGGMCESAGRQWQTQTFSYSCFVHFLHIRHHDIFLAAFRPVPHTLPCLPASPLAFLIHGKLNFHPRYAIISPQCVLPKGNFS
jgi:hypothetical protein